MIADYDVNKSRAALEAPGEQETAQHVLSNWVAIDSLRRTIRELARNRRKPHKVCPIRIQGERDACE